jgi:hypothetical protein
MGAIAAHTRIGVGDLLPNLQTLDLRAGPPIAVTIISNGDAIKLVA